MTPVPYHAYRWSLSIIEVFRPDGSVERFTYERPSVTEPRPVLTPVEDGEAAWLVVAFILLVLSVGMAIGWQT